MIRLKQVKTIMGDAYLEFEYTQNSETKTITIDRRDVLARLLKLKQLLGRNPSAQDLKEVVIRIINELREGQQPLTTEFDYTQFIGVDLEQ